MADTAPDRKKVTQDDVARHAGVTRSVVSYVLTGNNRSVAPETRQRILEAIETLGYRPNKFAQGLGSGSENPLAARQIGIILNGAHVFLRPYYAEILAGVHAEAHEKNYHIRFIRFFHELDNPVLFNGLIHPEEVSGLVLIALDQSLSGPKDLALVEQIRGQVPNCVCVEWQHEGLPSVTFDRQAAARMATAHLISLGHRNLAYCGESDQRPVGFRQALEEAGIQQPPLMAPGGDTRAGYTSGGQLLTAHPELTGIVAGSDEVAFGLLNWCAENGLRVPEDLAVVSIDDIEMAEYSIPPLTTIRVPKEAMGRQAVQILLQRQNNPQAWAGTTLLPTTLISRRSSGQAISRSDQPKENQ